MLAWVWYIWVTYHDVQDLHMHELLHEYMYVRMIRNMSTLLYVHVTKTHHTNTRTHNTHTSLGLYVCILIVCALQEVQHVSTFTPLALGSDVICS